jgi:hypothetical protein
LLIEFRLESSHGWNRVASTIAGSTFDFPDYQVLYVNPSQQSSMPPASCRRWIRRNSGRASIGGGC